MAHFVAGKYFYKNYKQDIEGVNKVIGVKSDHLIACEVNIKSKPKLTTYLAHLTREKCK